MSASPSTPSASSAPTDVSSIVPGSIFQDDIPPPTFTDGSGGIISDPSQQYTPPNGEGTGGSTQIEVNGTIQIVLISLGIAVAALFLVGIAAGYFISHKNKKAEKLKQEEEMLPPVLGETKDRIVDLEQAGGGGAADGYQDGAGVGTGEKGGSNSGGSMHSDSQMWSQVQLLAGAEKEHEFPSESGSIAFSSRPGTPGMMEPSFINSGSNPSSIPTGSQILQEFTTPGGRGGGAGAGAGAGLAAGRHININNNNNNARSSINDVAQAYALQQSMMKPISPIGLQQQHYPVASNLSDSEMQARSDMSMDANLNRGQERSNNKAATTTTAGQGLVNPFKTHNNSCASVDVLGALATPPLSIKQEGGHHRKIQSLSGSFHASTIPSKDDWKFQMAQTPISAPVVMSSATAAVTAAASDDISYQPPSQPTSPMSRYDYSKRQGSYTKPWSQQDSNIVTTTAMKDEGSVSFFASPPRKAGFRNGAAVFEGAHAHHQPQQGGIPSRLNGRSSTDEGGRASGGGHIYDDETVIVSLPSPRGCLLEASSEESLMEGQFEGQPPTEYRMYPHHQQHHYSYPKVVPRAAVDQPQGQQHQGNDKGKQTATTMVRSSYLDDYREQRLHQEQEQEQQQQQDGSGTRFGKAGLKLSTKLQSNLYSPSNVAHEGDEVKE